MTPSERFWYGVSLLLFVGALLAALLGAMREIHPAWVFLALLGACGAAVGLIVNRGTRWD